MRPPRVIQVIECESELRGTGTEADPYYRVTQYRDFDGNLLAEARPPQPKKRRSPPDPAEPA